MDDRRAELLAAAEAVRSWVHRRRATWRAEPVDVYAPPAPPALPARNEPEPTWQQPVPLVPVFTESTPHPVTANDIVPDLPEVETGPSVLSRIATQARSLGAPLGRWSLRAAAAAAIVAALAGAGWAARAYWLKLAAAPKTGTAVLESTPPGSQVLVDGAAVGTTPVTAELAVGRHVVEFRYRNTTRRIGIEVTVGRSTVGRIDWNAKPTGRLQVDSNPAGAQVIIDGRARGVTPLTVDDLSVGSHAVVLQTAEGSLRRTVAITADQAAHISESIYSGWLKLLSPIDLEISEGRRTIRLDDQHQVLLSPGSHELRFQNRALGFQEIRRVELNPGETTSVTIVPPPSTITVTATLPSEVSIDGDRAGATPLTDHPISLGTRDILVKNSAGTERRFTITVTVKPVRLDVDFSKP